jgi:hypothetical protein
MGTKGPFPGVKRGRGVTLTTHPHLVPRSRVSSSYTPLPPNATMACSGTALLLYIFKNMFPIMKQNNLRGGKSHKMFRNESRDHSNHRHHPLSSNCMLCCNVWALGWTDPVSKTTKPEAKQDGGDFRYPQSLNIVTCSGHLYCLSELGPVTLRFMKAEPALRNTKLRTRRTAGGCAGYCLLAVHSIQRYSLCAGYCLLAVHSIQRYSLCAGLLSACSTQYTPLHSQCWLTKIPVSLQRQ